MKILIAFFVFILVVIVSFLIYDFNSYVPNGIKSNDVYKFYQSKHEVEGKIDSLISFDSEISRQQPFNDENKDYYNSNGYYTVFIDSVKFCFRFAGKEADWSTDNCEIFIISFNSMNGEGNGNEIQLFEDKIIQRIR